MNARKKPQKDMINFSIDGQPVQAKPGWTILETARHYHIHIPTLCFHPAVLPWGSCRLCVVETRYGKRGRVIPSCLNPPVHELEVFTHSERVQNVRRWVLEMLLAECPASREIKKLAAEYGVTADAAWRCATRWWGCRPSPSVPGGSRKCWRPPTASPTMPASGAAVVSRCVPPGPCRSAWTPSGATCRGVPATATPIEGGDL
jgi:hypothetical protein